MSDTWTRDEHIVALDLYLNHSDIVEDSSDPEIQEVAELIGRSPDSVVFRLGNYRYLDSRSTHGLSNISKGCREIWGDFYGNEEELSVEADRARQRLSSNSSSSENGFNDSNSGVNTGSIKTTSTQRRGQTDFRAAVRERFNDTCLLCNIARPGLLQAGHILPWSEFKESQGDIGNGILLCYTHHRAFDLGLFTITESHKVVTQPDVSDLGSFLERTLVDTDSVVFPEEPSSEEYLKQRNERLDWWPSNE